MNCSQKTGHSDDSLKEKDKMLPVWSESATKCRQKIGDSRKRRTLDEMGFFNRGWLNNVRRVCGFRDSRRPPASCRSAGAIATQVRGLRSAQPPGSFDAS